MDTNDLRGQLINTYLNHQLVEAQEAGAMQHIELPDAAILDEFKNHVRAYIELDNTIRKLKGLLKERNNLKKQLNEKILKFMAKYNIEDLNTRDGSKLRYKVTTTKAAPTKADIKDRLVQYYGNVDNVDELAEKVFQKNQKEVVSLRRLNTPKE